MSDTPRTDTERLDALESYLWSTNVGNGIAIFPSTLVNSGIKLVMLQDLGDEDGSDLGEEITQSHRTLRECLDELP